MSSETDASVLFNAVCISSGVPSKNRLQPEQAFCQSMRPKNLIALRVISPWNRASPVKITFPVESSINQQILSCVWHGVYNALTETSPNLKVSPSFGVLVTASQSLPPIIDFTFNSGTASCCKQLLEEWNKTNGLRSIKAYLPIFYFLRHGRNGWTYLDLCRS